MAGLLMASRDAGMARRLVTSEKVALECLQHDPCVNGSQERPRDPHLIPAAKGGGVVPTINRHWRPMSVKANGGALQASVQVGYTDMCAVGSSTLFRGLKSLWPSNEGRHIQKRGSSLAGRREGR